MKSVKDFLSECPYIGNSSINRGSHFHYKSGHKFFLKSPHFFLTFRSRILYGVVHGDRCKISGT